MVGFIKVYLIGALIAFVVFFASLSIEESIVRASVWPVSVYNLVSMYIPEVPKLELTIQE